MFGKIFKQIYDSSIAEDWTVRTVFQDFIVLADINGVVDKTPHAISRQTNVPIEIVLKAIALLESPDPSSRSPEDDGRRIRRLDEHRDWGWEIVNYEVYRDMASDEQRREKTKLRTRKWRSGNEKQLGDAPVTLGDAGDAKQRQRQKQRQKQKQQDKEEGNGSSGDAAGLPRDQRFPCTVDDALRQCALTEVPKEFVMQCWDKADYRGGKDGREILIRNFPGYVRTEWKYEQDRRGREKHSSGNGVNGDSPLSGADKMIAQKEFERCDKAIQDLRGSYDSHQQMTEKDRGKMKSLLERRKALKNKLQIEV